VVTLIIREDQLCSPTVGTWYPSTAVSQFASEGVLLGRIFQARKWIDVHAPKGAHGVLDGACEAGHWCERGTPLF
jgi:hypothetical protein